MPVAQNSKAPRPYGVEFPSQPRSNFLFEPVGTWLSLVEHSLGVRGVGSSNLPVPTISRHCVSVPFVVSHACFNLRDGLIHKLDRSYPVATLV